MLFSPTMRAAVFHATVLCTISMLYDHYFTKAVLDQVLQDEGWIKMMDAVNNSMVPTGTPRGNGRLTLDAENPTNSTLSLNQTAPTGLNKDTMWSDLEESFYCQFLPRELVVFIVYSVLQYWWLIGLEKLLPSRPRNREVLSERKEHMEENEDREEEIVKKWIAQGRVRRASLNWCNTFLKWVLDLTIGRLWLCTVIYVVRSLLKLQSPLMIFQSLKASLAIKFVSIYFSYTPLVHLVAFVVVPAHRQIVFIEGVDLVTTIFLSTLVRVFATWAVKTDYVQTAMKNVTESALRKKLHSENTAQYHRN